MTATQPSSKKQFLEIYRREGSHEQAWAMRLVYEGGSHDIFYMNEPLEVRRPEFEPCDGYVSAFYEIAKVLDIPAMPISPKEGFETVMLPKLRALVEGASQPPSERSPPAKEAGDGNV